MSNLTFEVKAWEVEPRGDRSGKIISYRLRWSVARRTMRKTFDTRAHATAYRASLVTATNKGEPFLLDLGVPLSSAPQQGRTTWYEFTLTYTDAKWAHLSPNSRRGLSEALIATIERARAAA